MENNIIVNTIFWLVASVVSAVIYRLGGVGKQFNTKIRDLGVPFVGYALFCFLYKPDLLGYFWVFLSVGFSFASLTTYFSFVVKPDDDVCLVEWAITGFVYGISAFLLVLCGVHWWMILIRAVVLSLLTALWSQRISDVNLEEGGRGFLFTSTIPLLCI